MEKVIGEKEERRKKNREKYREFEAVKINYQNFALPENTSDVNVEPDSLNKDENWVEGFST